MAYKILIEKQPLKFLANVPKRDYVKIKEHIDSLAENPHPPGSIKLAGSEDEYRIRYGNYRIIYTVEDDILTVYVIKIDHRKNVYR